MRLNEIQRYNIQNEYLRLLDKMIEPENRRNEVEDEQQKNIITNQLKTYYWKIYTMKIDYNLLTKKFYY
jgi:hypothetical protein